jgi:hypothetical protein
MTTGRSLEAKTSAIEWSANAIPCRPSQHVSPNSTPAPRSRMYKEKRVESASCHDMMLSSEKGIGTICS